MTNKIINGFKYAMIGLGTAVFLTAGTLAWLIILNAFMLA